MSSQKQTVAILCGGLSLEHEISIKSAKNVYTHIDRSTYNPVVLYVTRQGVWNIIQRNVNFENIRCNKSHFFTPLTFLGNNNDFKKYQIDIVFNCIHGSYGEDGTVQAILNQAGVAYTGSGVLASSAAYDKYVEIKYVDYGDIDEKVVSKYQTVDIEHIQNCIDCIRSLDYVIVKPRTGGSSYFTQKLKRDDVEGVQQAVVNIIRNTQSDALIQEFIEGREFTCGVITSPSKADPLVVLPVWEIIPHSEVGWFNHESKYSKPATELHATDLNKEVYQDIQAFTADIHDLYGCSGLTRCDFILGEDNQLYFLEINTVPGLTETSLVPQMAQHAGISMTELITIIIESIA